MNDRVTANPLRIHVGALLLGVLTLAVLMTRAFSDAAGAPIVEGPFTLTNDTGVIATDLHVTFAGTGGTLTPPVAITQQPAAAPAPTVAVGPNTVNIDWGVKAIPAGDSVKFTVTTGIPGITPAAVRWTEFGNSLAIGAVLWPVALKPSVTGNFGTLEVPDMHSALDIDAPKDTPVRAVVRSTLVAIFGNGVYFSDGTNLYAFGHTKKTVGNHGTDFVAADIGKVFDRGQTFGFVTGTGNPGGGSFDHVHFEFIPNRGTDAFIKNPGGTYKGAGAIIALADPHRVNPLVALFDVKDPGNKAPEIGPIFWKPNGDNVAGFVEFGQQQTAPGVRRGTFINGEVDVIQQITDNQGGRQPPGGSQKNDSIDNTIKIDDIIISDPFKVSYRVRGTGVVADKGISERDLVVFNRTHEVHNGQKDIVFDRRRDVDVPGVHPIYNHMFVLTNTDGTKPVQANSWFTRAKAGAGQPDGTGAALAANNAEGLFPDGIYRVDGFGFDIGADGSPANKTSITYEVRLNNWKQTAVPTKGGPTPPDIKRADDKFEKNGKEISFAEFLETYDLYVDLVFGAGDNYLAGRAYPWFIFRHDLSGWEQDELFSGALLFGFTRPSDSTGHIPDTFLTKALTLGFGDFDLIFDYDFNGHFSWTLDGLGAFQVVTQPSTVTLLIIGALSVVGWCRRRWDGPIHRG